MILDKFLSASHKCHRNGPFILARYFKCQVLLVREAQSTQNSKLLDKEVDMSQLLLLGKVEYGGGPILTLISRGKKSPWAVLEKLGRPQF